MFCQWFYFLSHCIKLICKRFFQTCINVYTEGFRLCMYSVHHDWRGVVRKSASSRRHRPRRPLVANVLPITDNDTSFVLAPAPDGDTDLTSEHASSRAQLWWRRRRESPHEYTSPSSPWTQRASTHGLGESFDRIVKHDLLAGDTGRRESCAPLTLWSVGDSSCHQVHACYRVTWDTELHFVFGQLTFFGRRFFLIDLLIDRHVRTVLEHWSFFKTCLSIKWCYCYLKVIQSL